MTSLYVVGVISNDFPNCQDKRAVHIYHGSFVTENIVDYIFEGVIMTIACINIVVLWGMEVYNSYM